MLLLLTMVSELSGQFTLSAEVRPRTEFRNGFKTPTTDANDPGFFTEQRSRLYLDYKNEKYKMKLAFQDVRIWGETGQIFKTEEDATTFLSEAWGQVMMSDTWSLKLGRQIISYDNQRFLGGLEWAQQGRRHDALLFMNETEKSKLHFGFAFNNDVPFEPGFLQGPGINFFAVNSYKSLQYGWYNQKFGKGSQISLLALNAVYQNGDEADPSTHSTSAKQTFGLYGKIGLTDKLTLGGDVYYQSGEFALNNVNAFLAGLNLTFNTPATPITIGFEHISGKDDDDTSSDITNFSPDFGTNHAFNGFMDYFFVGPANGNVGVTDIFAKTKFKLKKGAFIVNAHQFLTGSTQLDGDGNELSKAMGFEVDLVLVKPLAPSVTMHVGFSQLFATDTMTALRPGDASSNNWAWLMFTFKPQLLSVTE